MEMGEVSVILPTFPREGGPSQCACGPASLVYLVHFRCRGLRPALPLLLWAGRRGERPRSRRHFAAAARAIRFFTSPVT